jgi:hypothetical protein
MRQERIVARGIRHAIRVLEFTSDSAKAMKAYSDGEQAINGGLCSLDDLRFVVNWSNYMSQYGRCRLTQGLACDLGLLADTRLKRHVK